MRNASWIEKRCSENVLKSKTRYRIETVQWKPFTNKPEDFLTSVKGHKQSCVAFITHPSLPNYHTDEEDASTSSEEEASFLNSDELQTIHNEAEHLCPSLVGSSLEFWGLPA